MQCAARADSRGIEGLGAAFHKRVCWRCGGVSSGGDAIRAYDYAALIVPAHQLLCAIVKCKKKLYETACYNGVGWVDKPNVSYQSEK